MMTKGLKTFLYILGGLLVALISANAVMYILFNTSKLTVLDPVSKTINVFSYFKKTTKPKKVVFGYLPSWSLDSIKYIQLDKMTDIAYFGLAINPDGTFATLDADGNQEQGYAIWKTSKSVAQLIADSKKAGVRVSLTVISHIDSISDQFLSCKSCWVTFRDNLIKELDRHKIKDVNFNCEYVDFQQPEMAAAYSELVGYINTELDKRYGDSFVTVATFADSMIKPRVTDIASLGKVADGLFIMAYDFHRPDSDTAGPVAPIDGMGTISEYDITNTIKDYETVVSPGKLILGVPYYGYNWVVRDTSANAERIPGNDAIGYSQSQAYVDIMNDIIQVQPKLLWNDVAKEPYFTYVSPATGSTREVYFENEQSLKVKYDLVNEKGLMGVGIWALGYDGGYQELWRLLGSEF
jgi:spore germination protein YaaH